MRLTVRLSMATVALAAALLSYQSLMHLGVLCGYGNLAWLYPVVVDAGAAASCAAWLHTRGRQALAMTWSLLAVSVVLNGTTHYLESTHTAPSWLLVVAVAAVPPSVLGLTVHLAVGMRSPDQREGLNTLGGAAPTPDVPLGSTQVSGETDGAPVALCDDPVTKLIQRGAGRRTIAAELNISEYKARRLIAASTRISRNGDGHVPT